MKTSVVKIFAGSGIRLAVLSVLFLGMSGVCMGQASVAAARPDAQAAGAPQAKPAAKPAQTEEPTAPAAKGTSEGIKVHGHWIIEVHNPDGTLVTHREFENSLCTNNEAACQSTLVGGASLLAAVFGHTAVPGGWVIKLYDSTQAIFILEITESGSNFAILHGCPGPNCSTNLVVAAPEPVIYGALQPLPLTLSGSVTVPSGAPAAIGYVYTVNLYCNTVDPYPGAGAISPQDCFNDSGAELSASENGGYPPEESIFTARALDGMNGDPAAVPITAGQTVNVTVVISFQ